MAIGEANIYYKITIGYTDKLCGGPVALMQFFDSILTRLVFMFSYRGLPEPSAIMNSVYTGEYWIWPGSNAINPKVKTKQV